MEGYIGYVQLLRDNQEVARRLLVAAIESFQEYYEKTSIIPGEPGDGWFIFDGKARLELQDGHLERAAQLFGAAWNQRELGNNPISEAERADYEACILEIRAVIGDARFEVLFKEGQLMKIKDALFLAMG